MATNSFSELRSLLLKDGLPIGMAITKRVWNNGPKDIIKLFTQLESPVDQLRQEGNEAAHLVLDRLDKIQLDFGMPFTIAEKFYDQAVNNSAAMPSRVQLLENLLTQIDKDLVLLKKYTRES